MSQAFIAQVKDSQDSESVTDANFASVASVINGGIEVSNLTPATVTALTPTPTTGQFKTARHAGTNATFNDTYTTVDSVSITLAVASIVTAYGSCDARFNDTSFRTCRSKIVSNIGGVDTLRSGEVFQVVGHSTANLRTQLNAAAAMSLAAGTYTIKFMCQNGTNTDSMTTDNSHIEVASTPST